MGTIVHFPLRHKVKIREDVIEKLSRVGARERLDILEDIQKISRMGYDKLSNAMSISVRITSGRVAALYGVLLTAKRVFILKCRKNKLFVCSVVDLNEELRRIRFKNEVVLREEIRHETGTCQMVAMLTPAHTVLLFGLIRAAGFADELHAKELALAA
jgi:hypothetical protein